MGFLSLLIQGLIWIVIADALLSWVVPSPDKFPRSITNRIAGPICAPIRALIDPKKTGGIDLSPMLAIFLLQGLRMILLSAGA